MNADPATTSSQLSPYSSLEAHLADEFWRIDLLLDLAEIRIRGRGSDPSPAACGLLDQIKEAGEKIGERIKLTRNEGLLLPGDRLSSAFGLSAFDKDVVWLAAAPLAEPGKYAKRYEALSREHKWSCLTLELLMLLFASKWEEKVQLRERFLAHAPLARHRLVEVSPDQRFSENGARLPSAEPGAVRLDLRIADFLLGSQFTDPKTVEVMSFVSPSGEDLSGYYSPKLKRSLSCLERKISESISNCHQCFLFYGPPGNGKTGIAAAMASHLDIPILKVDFKALLEQPERRDLLFRIVRDARLFDAALIVQNFGGVTSTEEDEKTEHFRTTTVQNVSSGCFLSFFIGDHPTAVFNQFSGARFIKLEFPLPSYEIRQRAWDDLFERYAHSGSLKSSELAGKFSFTPGQMNQAMIYARDRRYFQEEGEGKITDEDLIEGCRSQCNHRLAERAGKIDVAIGWSHLVLPEDQIEQLREICLEHRNQARVYGEWGFGKRIVYGRGENVLFSGHPGTGKTLAASIIANDLNLELYRVDLSVVISKYIGETEKNLSQIFKEAERSNAILFFDEADALFGKRTEVKDSHDRYANIETSYLLQKMEDYDGVTILATNLKQNMDEAFMRRMRFIVHFPFPEAEHRKRIWNGIFPDEVSLADDIDFDFLAERLQITGGNIRNIALTAAFFAADRSAPISMSLLLKAARREYQKIGKAFIQEDFEPYYSSFSVL